MSDPRQALPAIRPRCCFRYLTFFGINMALCPPARRAARRAVIFFAADPRGQALALVEPHLDADAAVGGERLREAVVDVGAQRLQRQLPVQVPLRARDFRAVQATRHAYLD